MTLSIRAETEEMAAYVLDNSLSEALATSNHEERGILRPFSDPLIT